MGHNFSSQAEALLPEMIERRRDFHRHPELGFQEYRTSAIVAEELTKLGLEVQTGVGKTGVVGLMEGDKPGPTILMRFDMDALPIEEANPVEYVSQTPGVMHACGHDGHTAIGLGVAKMLMPLRQQMAGTLKFVFQPAEEGLGGAEAMVKDGIMSTPNVEHSLVLHVWNNKPVGWVAATDGPAMAANDKFLVHLQGKGGHAASPYLGKDPVLAAAHIITALQSIPARNVSALDSAIISVTAVKGGEAFNVIPDSVTLVGTIRSFKKEVRDLVMTRFDQIVNGIAQALDCPATIKHEALTSVVSNDPGLSKRVRDLAVQIPGVEHIVDDERGMGSDDASFMMDNLPSCYFMVGSANSGKGLDFPHHHPRFDFDERAMLIGATLMAEAAAQFVMGSDGLG